MIEPILDFITHFQGKMGAIFAEIKLHPTHVRTILASTSQLSKPRFLSKFFAFRGFTYPSAVENVTFDKASAPGLQQAKPMSSPLMCKHMGDTDSCKDGDAGSAKK